MKKFSDSAKATTRTTNGPLVHSLLMPHSRRVVAKHGTAVSPTKTTHHRRHHHARGRLRGWYHMATCNSIREQRATCRPSRPEVNYTELYDAEKLRRREALKKLHWHGKPVPEPKVWLKPTCPLSHHHSQDGLDHPVKSVQELQKIKKGRLTEEQMVAREEVRALPDDVVSARQGQRSEILERFFATRRKKHETAVQDMTMELLKVAEGLEGLVANISKETMVKLSQAKRVVDFLVPPPPDDSSELLKFTWEELQDAMEKICLIHNCHKHSIDTSIAQLYKMEESRVEKIRVVFDKYYEKLANINHLTEAEVRTLIEEQKVALRVALINNQHSIADLEYHLQLYQYQIERDRLQLWQQAVVYWKQISLEDYMNRMCGVLDAGWEPPGRDEQFLTMVQDVATINAKRKPVLDSLSRLSPLNCDRARIQTSVNELGELQKEILMAVEGNLSKMHTLLQDSARSTLSQMKALCGQMVEEQRVSEQKARAVLVESLRSGFFVLIRDFETQLEYLETTFNARNAELVKQQSILIRYLQGCGHLVELQTISLQCCERELRVELDELELSFRRDENKLNAQYAAMLVRARQETLPEALPGDYTMAKSVLEALLVRYQNLRDDQLTMLPHYSKFVSKEVDRYDQAVRTFFLVDRTLPTTREFLIQIGKMRNLKRKVSNRSIASSMFSKGSKKAVDIKLDGPWYDCVGELRTGRGTIYYVLKKTDPEQAAKEASSPSPSKISDAADFRAHPEADWFSIASVSIKSQVTPSGPLIDVLDDDVTDGCPESPRILTPDEEGMTSVPIEWQGWIKCFDIPEADFTNIKDVIRMNFLNHLDTLPDESAAEAEAYLRMRVDALLLSQDLYAHVHAIREKELKEIIETRRQELEMHEEKVTEHVDAMREATRMLRRKREAVKEQHRTLVTKYKRRLDRLARQIREADTKLDVLLVQHKVQTRVEKTMAEIRKSFVEYARYADSELFRVKRANNWLYEHLKAFKDGGNFSNEERANYVKMVEMEAKQVEALEQKLRSDVATVEIKYLEELTRAAMEWEEKTEDVYLGMTLKVVTDNTKEEIRRQMHLLQVESNMQKGAIDRHIKSLKERKSKNALFSMTSFLKQVWRTIRERCEYLSCLPEESGEVPEPPAADEKPSPQSPAVRRSSSAPNPLGPRASLTSQRNDADPPSRKESNRLSSVSATDILASIPPEYWYIKNNLYREASVVCLAVPDLSLQTAPLPKDFLVTEATQAALSEFAPSRNNSLTKEEVEPIIRQVEFKNPYPDYAFLGKAGALLRAFFPLLMHRVKVHYAVNRPAASISDPTNGKFKVRDPAIFEECRKAIDDMEQWFISIYREAHQTRLNEIAGLIPQLKELEEEASEVPELQMCKFFQKHIKCLTKALASVERWHMSLFDSLLAKWKSIMKAMKERPRQPSLTSVEEVKTRKGQKPRSKQSRSKLAPKTRRDSQVTKASSDMTLEVASLFNHFGPALLKVINTWNSALVSALDKKTREYVALYDKLIVDDDVEHLKQGKFRLCDLLRRFRDCRPLTYAEEVAQRRIRRKGHLWPRITSESLLPLEKLEKSFQQQRLQQEQALVSKIWLAFMSEGRDNYRANETKTVSRLWKTIQANKDTLISGSGKKAADGTKPSAKSFWKKIFLKVAVLPVDAKVQIPLPSPLPRPSAEEEDPLLSQQSGSKKKSSLKKDGERSGRGRRSSVTYAADVKPDAELEAVQANLLETSATAVAVRHQKKLGNEPYVKGKVADDEFVTLIRTYRSGQAQGFFTPVSPRAPIPRSRSKAYAKFYASERTTKCHIKLFEAVEREFQQYKELSVSATKKAERLVTMADLAALRFARAWDNNEIQGLQLYDLLQEPHYAILDD